MKIHSIALLLALTLILPTMALWNVPAFAALLEPRNARLQRLLAETSGDSVPLARECS